MQKSCLSYPVEFVEDVFGESPVLAETLKRVSGAESPRILIVADMNVVQRNEGLGARIGRYVQAHGIRLAGSPVVLAGGEKVKADNLQSALQVVSALLSAKLSRNDAVLAIGGGTILDVAGYAASQVRGGVGIVRLPTTPAAMMDAAFADWASVDSATVKDALRVPSVPAAVLIDASFASTVLDGVWRGGISVAVRLAAASDSALVKKLKAASAAYRARDAEALAEIVRAVVAVRTKKGDTEFARWASARLESLSGYKLPNGYATAIGICIDLGYAVERKLLKPKDRDTVVGILRDCGALDGLHHSGHLLSQSENLIAGLNAFELTTGSPSIVLACGLGKSTTEAVPDREIFRKVLKELASCDKAG